MIHTVVYSNEPQVFFDNRIGRQLASYLRVFCQQLIKMFFCPWVITHHRCLLQGQGGFNEFTLTLESQALMVATN